MAGELQHPQRRTRSTYSSAARRHGARKKFPYQVSAAVQQFSARHCGRLADQQIDTRAGRRGAGPELCVGAPYADGETLRKQGETAVAVAP